MLVTIDSDIDDCTKDVVEFFRDQVPFGLSRTLTDVAFAVRQDTVDRVWMNSFKVRNNSMARRAFQVTKKALKNDLVAEVGQTLDRDWISTQATGGIKKPRGASVAIPVQPEAIRTSGGAVKKAFKPRNLKNAFRTKKGIFVRDREGDLQKAFTLTPSAKIPKRFMFYEEAQITATKVFSGLFAKNMDAAIRRSRFFPV